jgi:hypothetical protein
MKKTVINLPYVNNKITKINICIGLQKYVIIYKIEARR